MWRHNQILQFAEIGRNMPLDIETPEKRQKVDVFSCAAGFEPVVFRKRDGDGWSTVREDPKCGNAQTAEGFVGFLRALPK